MSQISALLGRIRQCIMSPEGKAALLQLIQGVLVLFDVFVLFITVDTLGVLRGIVLTLLLNVVVYKGWNEWTRTITLRFVGVVVLLAACLISVLIFWFLGNVFNKMISVTDCLFEITVIEGAIIYALALCILFGHWHYQVDKS